MYVACERFGEFFLNAIRLEKATEMMNSSAAKIELKAFRLFLCDRRLS